MTRILVGDALERLRELQDGSVHCCVTSPPYWRQRDYQTEGQIGTEDTPALYVESLVGVFSGVRRVLADDGTIWLNIGEKWASGGNGGGGSCMASRRDSAWAHARNNTGWRKPPAGFKDKDMVGAPWLVAHALREDGWYLRQCVIWSKGVATEPARLDRPSVSHEYLFQLTKGKDSRTRDPGEAWFHTSVWTVRNQPRSVDHPALMSEEIVRRCIVCSSREGDTVLDCFGGGGTTALVADRLQRDAILIEISATYAQMAEKRIREDAPLLTDVRVERGEAVEV